ncbi:MAG: hypothetical protein WC785_00860 [Tatlockia sp.]|jgi:hypothetical protein
MANSGSSKKIYDCISKQEQDLIWKFISAPEIETRIIEKKANTPPMEFQRFAVQLFFVSNYRLTQNIRKLYAIWNGLKTEYIAFFNRALENAILPNGINDNTAEKVLISRWMSDDTLYKTPYPLRLAKFVIESLLTPRAHDIQSALLPTAHIEWFVCQPNITRDEMILRIERVFKSQNNNVIKELFNFRIEGQVAIDWYLLQPSADNIPDWEKQTAEHILRIINTPAASSLNHLTVPLFNDISPLVFLVMIEDTIDAKIARCKLILNKQHINQDNKILFFEQISGTLPECIPLLLEAFPSLLFDPSHVLKRKAPLGFFDEHNPAKLPKRDENQEDVATGELNEAEQNRVALRLLKFAYQQVKNTTGIGSLDLTAFHELMNNPEWLTALENIRQEDTEWDSAMNPQLLEKLEAIIPLFATPHLFIENYHTPEGPVTPMVYCTVCSGWLLHVSEILKSRQPIEKNTTEQNRITITLMTWALNQLDNCVDERFSANIRAFRELMGDSELLRTLENTTPEQTIIDIEMNEQLAEKLKLIIPLFKETQLFPKDFVASDEPIEPAMYCELCFHVLTQIAEQLDTSSPGFRNTI